MPGFNSSFSSHSKATFDYLPKSIAYIIFLSAESPVLEESTIIHIKKMDIYDKPTYFVINKCDKATIPIEEIKEYYYKEISKYLGTKDVKIFLTGKKTESFNDGSQGLFSIMQELETDSNRLFDSVFAQRIKGNAIKCISSLKTYINGLDMSIDELNRIIAQLEKNMKSTEDSFVDIGDEILVEADNISDEIGANIKRDIEHEADTLFDMAVNKQERAVETRLELIVDKNISKGVKKLDKKLNKYFNNLHDTVNKNFRFDIPEFDNKEAEEIIKNIKSLLENISSTIGGTIGSIISGTAGSIVLPTAGSSLVTSGIIAESSAIASIAGPLGTVVGALIGLGISYFVSKGIRNRKIEQQREPFTNELLSFADKATIDIKKAFREKITQIQDAVLSESNSAFEATCSKLEEARASQLSELDNVNEKKDNAINDIKTLEEIIKRLESIKE